jgi:pyruvate/2-oxoglutarate/acetoin dehydrogenase E1 component
MTYAEALNEALREEMRRDPTVFVMGEDVAIWGGGGVFGVTKGLVDEFGPDRIRDTPIAEQVIAAAAVGAAATGTRPVAEIMYVDFMALAMEPIVNQAAKMRYMFGGKIKLPLVIRAQQGAGRGNAAQHSQSLEAWFAHIPGLKVVVPSTPADAKGLLKTAIRDDNPVIFLEHKVLYFTRGEVPEGEYTIPFGQAELRRGSWEEPADCTVVSFGRPVNFCLEAADELLKEGVRTHVLDMRTIRPLDMDSIVRSVKATNRIVVVDQCWPFASVASEVVTQTCERAFDWLDHPPVRVNADDVPTPYAKNLEAAFLPNKGKIVHAVKATLGR